MSLQRTYCLSGILNGYNRGQSQAQARLKDKLTKVMFFDKLAEVYFEEEKNGFLQ
jgi:hypothetical protein